MIAGTEDIGLAELAHANRIAILAQLSTSIAHEVKQPIAAAINNALGRIALDQQRIAGSGEGSPIA